MAIMQIKSVADIPSGELKKWVVGEYDANES